MLEDVPQFVEEAKPEYVCPFAMPTACYKRLPRKDMRRKNRVWKRLVKSAEGVGPSGVVAGLASAQADAAGAALAKRLNLWRDTPLDGSRFVWDNGEAEHTVPSLA